MIRVKPANMFAPRPAPSSFAVAEREAMRSGLSGTLGATALPAPSTARIQSCKTVEDWNCANVPFWVTVFYGYGPLPPSWAAAGLVDGSKIAVSGGKLFWGGVLRNLYDLKKEWQASGATIEIDMDYSEQQKLDALFAAQGAPPLATSCPTGQCLISGRCYTKGSRQDMAGGRYCFIDENCGCSGGNSTVEYTFTAYYDKDRKCIVQTDGTCIPVPANLQALTEEFGVAKLSLVKPNSKGEKDYLSPPVVSDIYVPAVLTTGARPPSKEEWEIIKNSDTYHSGLIRLYGFDLEGTHYVAWYMPDTDWTKGLPYDGSATSNFFKKLRQEQPWLFGRVYIEPWCEDWCNVGEVLTGLLLGPIKLVFALLDEILPCGSPIGEMVANAFAMYGSQFAHAMRCGGMSGCPSGQVPYNGQCVPNPCKSGLMYDNNTGKCTGGSSSILPWAIGGLAAAGLLTVVLLKKKKGGQ